MEKVRIVKIEFLRDQQDIRPDRHKIIPKGKVLTVTGELADQYIEIGAAKLLDNKSNSTTEQPKPRKYIPFLTWFLKLNTENKIGVIVLILALPPATAAVLSLLDRYKQPDRIEPTSKHTESEQLEEQPLQSNDPTTQLLNSDSTVIQIDSLTSQLPPGQTSNDSTLNE